MGDKNLADGLGLAALDQTLNVLAHLSQGFLQTFTLDRRRLATQRVIEHLQHLNVCRADGDAGRRRDRLQHAARGRGSHHSGNFCDFRCRIDQEWQRLDFFAQALFDCGKNRRQSIIGNRRLGDKLQHLTTTHAQAEQFAQTLGRHSARLLAVKDSDANVAVKTLGQLRENFCRAGVQTVGIGQSDARTRPVSR